MYLFKQQLVDYATSPRS